MGKFALAKFLVSEMKDIMSGPGITLSSSERVEWTKILTEMCDFIDAMDSICPVDEDGGYIHGDLCSRIDNRRMAKLRREKTMARSDRAPSSEAPNFEEAILVCCHTDQARFSDLTVDIYRLIHALEVDISYCATDKPDISSKV